VKIARLIGTGIALALIAAAAAAGTAGLGGPGYTGTADFVQHLGRSVPAGLHFRDEHDKVVELGDYLGAAPIGLLFAYYQCTNLCPMQIRNLAQRMALTSGGAADAQVLVVSIDPLDTPALADRAKHKYLDDLLPAARAERWHFLSGASAQIAQLTKALGFSYGYDQATHQFAHPAGFTLINADGQIARYFFGFDYTAADLGNAFDAAAARRIASPIARLLLVCFHYDINTGRHTGRILEVLRVVSTITLLGALAVGWNMLRRARRRRHSQA
jgi:protein SCO1/2